MLNFKEFFVLKKPWIFVSSTDSFEDVVIEISNNSKGNVVHNDIHNIVVGTNVDQVDNLNDSDHLRLHETQNKWNPPVLELFMMVVSEFHNL